MQGRSVEPFHVMAKPTGAVCNLDCRYCYYLTKDMLYPGDRFRMGTDVLDEYLRQLVESHAGGPVTVAWQGGEPTLMGLDFFRDAIERVYRHAPQGTTIHHTLQTNGTLLDDEWCRFLSEHGFLVGLSLDGPRDLHDTYRVDKRGRGTHDTVAGAAHRLRRHGVAFNILCTVHGGNVDQPLRIYRYFRDDLHARHMQFIPIVERITSEQRVSARQGWGRGVSGRTLYTQSGTEVTERSVDPDRWGRFLITMFDEWWSHDLREVFVQQFENALESWLSMEPSLCVFRSTCGRAPALEHNGDVYACDHYVEPGYFLGNLTEDRLADMLESPDQIAFGQAKRDGLPAQCLRCPVRFACNGGCPRNRFTTSVDGEPGLNYLCAGYRAFFEYIDPSMRRMARALRRSGAVGAAPSA